MSRDNTKTPNGFWGLWVAVFGWIAPMGVYFVLLQMFRKDAVWSQVGPYLMVSFSLLAVFAQVGALFMAAIAWPAKSAFLTVFVALLLFVWNAVLLYQGLRQVG